MMPKLTALTPLVTIAEADAVLADSTAWTGLTDDAKTLHLLKGSVWIRTNYTCANVDFEDSSALPSIVKEAVILFAFEDMQGNLYSSEGSTVVTGTVKKESLKAGPVQQTLEYEAGTAKVVTGLDPFPFVTGLLNGVCVFVGDEGTSTVQGGSFPVDRT